MIYVFFGARMKRIIGFALFFFGLGMLAMFLIPSDFCGILIMIGFVAARRADAITEKRFPAKIEV